MSGITDYFAGFKKLDIFLLLYLFYQMPIHDFLPIKESLKLILLLITIFISRHTILQILAAHPVFINLLNKMVTQPSSQ